ncbi:PLP-dependent aminotransferase family protein [Streptomyces sp. NPDC093260]|uniref:aminotransferase-like domain-containing protein n=1 Tax=Streptomyces sp. NPDC093260 TaxID=3155073 RepID=UPI0034309D57
MRLHPSSLHGSLQDPVLGAIGFLNEVMGNFPEAISFAPGAPHPDTLDDLDVEKYVSAFTDHLVRGGRSPKQARRLLLEYGPSRGIINGIIADALHRDHGIDVTPNALVVTVGAQEAMLLVLRALFPSPAEGVLAVAHPCFVGIIGAARLLDVEVVAVDETEGGIDLDSLARACGASRAAGRPVRALYVAPDFSNPGAARMSLECRRRLLDLAGHEGFLVVEDNAYGFTAASGAGLPPLKALDSARSVVHIGTFAKVAFPGARVGYVIADQPVGSASGTTVLADELAAVKSMVTVNTSPLSQAVIGGMLLEHGGSVAALGRDKAEIYQRNLTCLLDALDRRLGDGSHTGVHWNRPRGGFFVRMTLPVPVDAALLEVSAAEHGVLWTPMRQFYLDRTGDHQLRLSCSYLDPGQIEEGVRRLAAFLTSVVRHRTDSGGTD